MAHILSIEEIIEAKDVTEKSVEVPQWGGSVVVKSISHRVMRQIRKSLAAESDIESEDDVDEEELEKWIFIKGMVQPTVTEADYERMLEKSTGAMQTILSAILGSSKVGESAIKEAEKNFPAEPVGDVPVQSGGESLDDGGAPVDGTFGAVES